MNIAKLMAMLQFEGKRTPVLTVNKGISFLRETRVNASNLTKVVVVPKFVTYSLYLAPPRATPIGFPLLKTKTTSIIGFIDRFFLK